MSTPTIRIPEGEHERLRNLAKARSVIVNRLIDELATAALAEYDSEIRFRAMAARGSKESGLTLPPNSSRGVQVQFRPCPT
jgi:hypothetical protein